MDDTPLRWYQRPSTYLLLAIPVLILGVLFSASAGVLSQHYRTYFIPSAAMEPTLQIGDHFFVDNWAYRKKPLQRGDVIVFRSPENPSITIVSRCIAVGGDSVEIRDKRLSINGQPVAEPYARYVDPTVHQNDGLTSFGKRDQLRASKVPPDSCYVLGDNRDNSYDSRFWGSVHNSLLRGQALYIYWAKDRSKIGRRIR
ncbi:MAG TPA: signal peptidase I [Thermoanaerobaculia bacterium]|jgi:signal peptidase I|nr:signal peptidase I [Thermoanaerobaculia bacterium]